MIQQLIGICFSQVTQVNGFHSMSDYAACLIMWRKTSKDRSSTKYMTACVIWFQEVHMAISYLDFHFIDSQRQNYDF